MKRSSLLPYALIAALMLAVALLFLASRSDIFTSSLAVPSKGSPIPSLPLPPATCNYCPAQLLNASPEEIGQFAVKYATDKGEVKGVPPQVVLVRHITPEDYPTLGLGCSPNQVTFEQPPLALIILKGDLKPSDPGLMPSSPEVKYIGYVFDLWADAQTSEMYSVDGSMFRTVLNDPTLPDDSSMPTLCPTPLPYKITLHYGEAVPEPTVSVPTQPVLGSPTPMPSDTIPLPIPTTGM